MSFYPHERKQKGFLFFLDRTFVVGLGMVNKLRPNIEQEDNKDLKKNTTLLSNTPDNDAGFSESSTMLE